MAERLWQMTRLGSGDYLLPSNDRQTLWRIIKYPERDGTLTRGDGSVVNGDFWSLWRWVFALDAVAENDVTDFGLWQEIACMLPTRQAAIDYALEGEQRDQVASHQGSSPAPHDSAQADGAGH